MSWKLLMKRFLADLSGRLRSGDASAPVVVILWAKPAKRQRMEMENDND